MRRGAAALCVVNVCGSCLALAGPAYAASATAVDVDAYPNRPLRFIVGFPAGGGSDILARMMGQKLQANLGQQVVIDNRPGASGVIAAQIAARSEPDGYTIFMGTSGSLAVQVSLYKKLGYAPLNDFAPVTLIASAQNVFVVHPSLRANSVSELIAVAKQKPGALSYASTGIGTSGHLAGELFKYAAGVDIVHVPYKGPAAMTDLVSGQVHLIFGRIPVVWPHVKNQRLRALAVTGLKRSALMPALPTIAESGLPGFEVTAWFGIVVPAGTARPIVLRLNAQILRILAESAVRQRLINDDFVPLTSTPEEFTAHVKSETEKWAKVIKAAGIGPD